jgi:hypothetical protein
MKRVDRHTVSFNEVKNNGSTCRCNRIRKLIRNVLPQQYDVWLLTSGGCCVRIAADVAGAFNQVCIPLGFQQSLSLIATLIKPGKSVKMSKVSVRSSRQTKIRQKKNVIVMTGLMLDNGPVLDEPRIDRFFLEYKRI